MISTDDQQFKDNLAIEEITYAIPAQSFNIACSITTDETLPVVTEFALRITYVCGSISPDQLQKFFGFSEKETSAVIKSLLSERLIQWNDDKLELTPYAEERFQESSDELPRFFKIKDWSAEVVFDLISFSPTGEPQRVKRTRSMIELIQQDPEKQSKTIQWAERSFQKNFRKIFKNDRADIYKISELSAGEFFSIPLPCVFHLNFDGQTSVQRNIDDASFGDRQEIAEAISDSMAGEDKLNNDYFENFIATFEDDVLKQYVSSKTFDLKKYVQDVHLNKVVGYSNSKISPILGSLHLKRNSSILLDWLQTWNSCDPLPDHDLNEGLSAIWLAPKSQLWSRSRTVRGVVQKLNQVMAYSTDEIIADDSSAETVDDVDTGVRVILQIGTSDHNSAGNIYRENFKNLWATNQTLMGGSLEMFFVPGRFVCALFHFSLEHQAVSVPLGFISSHTTHLEAASKLISKGIFEKGNINGLNNGKENNTQDSTRDFSFFLNHASAVKKADSLQVKSSNTLTLRKKE